MPTSSSTPGSDLQRSLAEPGHLAGAVPRAVGVDVRGVPGVVLAGAAARGARRRVPGAHLHHVPRLRARLAPLEQAARTRGSAPRSGLLVFTPFARWRYEHLIHHATAGDLDRRFIGDVPMFTVAEYRAKPLFFRFGYRLYRDPLVMFGLGSIYSTIIMQRFPTPAARNRMHRSVWLTNLAVVVFVAALCFAFGWQTVLFVELPIVILAGELWHLALLRAAPVRRHLLGAHRRVGLQRGRAARELAPGRCRRCCSSSAGTSASTTCTTSTRRSPTTTCQRAHEEQPMFRPVPSGVLHRRACARSAEALGRGLAADGDLEAGPRRQVTVARCSSVASHPPSRRTVGAATMPASAPRRNPMLSWYSAGADSASRPRAS